MELQLEVLDSKQISRYTPTKWNTSIFLLYLLFELEVGITSSLRTLQKR